MVGRSTYTVRDAEWHWAPGTKVRAMEEVQGQLQAMEKENSELRERLLQLEEPKEMTITLTLL